MSVTCPAVKLKPSGGVASLDRNGGGAAYRHVQAQLAATHAQRLLHALHGLQRHEVAFIVQPPATHRASATWKAMYSGGWVMWESCEWKLHTLEPW